MFLPVGTLSPTFNSSICTNFPLRSLTIALAGKHNIATNATAATAAFAIATPATAVFATAIFATAAPVIAPFATAVPTIAPFATAPLATAPPATAPPATAPFAARPVTAAPLALAIAAPAITRFATVTFATLAFAAFVVVEPLAWRLTGCFSTWNDKVHYFLTDKNSTRLLLRNESMGIMK